MTAKKVKRRNKIIRKVSWVRLFFFFFFVLFRFLLYEVIVVFMVGLYRESVWWMKSSFWHHLSLQRWMRWKFAWFALPCFQFLFAWPQIFAKAVAVTSGPIGWREVYISSKMILLITKLYLILVFIRITRQYIVHKYALFDGHKMCTMAHWRKLSISTINYMWYIKIKNRQIIESLNLKDLSWSVLFIHLVFSIALFTSYISRFDFYRTFATCSRCMASIRSSELVMRARNLVFHVPCFTCAMCNLALTKGDQFGMRDSQIFCRLVTELSVKNGRKTNVASRIC